MQKPLYQLLIFVFLFAFSSCQAEVVKKDSSRAVVEKPAGLTEGFSTPYPELSGVVWNPLLPVYWTVKDADVTNLLTASLNWNGQAYLLQPVISSGPFNSFRLSLKPLQPLQTVPEEGVRLQLFTNNIRVLDTNVVIDVIAPRLKIVTNSSKIVRGGSAAAVLEAWDDHLERVYVTDSNGEKYDAVPYKKAGQYLVFFVWPVYQGCSNLMAVARDAAGNMTTNLLKIDLINKKYPESILPLTTGFTKEKLAETGTELTNKNLTEQQKYNLLMQSFEEKKTTNIITLTSAYDDAIILNADFIAFTPLTNRKITAGFGEHRIQMLKGKKVGEAYHLGLDLARGQKATIFASASGKVVYSDYLGANGNTIIVYHGAYIYTLHAHCSEFLVHTGDLVKTGQPIARSGETGYALGDHLHYSIIIDGRYVNPLEWMNADWINENIMGVIR